MRLLSLSLGLLLLGVVTAWAETIRMKDKTKIKGQIVRMSDEQVMLAVPRDSVATVDGKPLPAALKEGAAAPAFSAADLQGTSWQLPRNGLKVTVLHFWVSWCPHCRHDAPQIQALYDRLHENSDVQIITVSLDEKREAIDRFIQEHHTTYPVIDSGGEAVASGKIDLAEIYQVSGFPVTFLIDGKGRIYKKITGSFTESGLDLEALVDKVPGT